MAKGYLKWIRFVIMLTPVNSLLSGMVYADGDETVSAVADLIWVIKLFEGQSV